MKSYLCALLRHGDVREVVFLHEGRIHGEGRPQDLLIAPGTERMREFLASHGQFRLPG